MSSEIEVEETTDHHHSTGNETGNGEIAGVPEESMKNDIYTAAAYGDMEKLRNLVESEGSSITKPDDLGYRALQWAALNNRVAAAQYILERGADVNAVDLTGQTALHWSAVRGAIQVADLLLEEGARVNAVDIYGYQTTHVAGQYGQTAFLFHIVTKWNADPDIPDNEGRSPLHWAAYKGFADSIRLLLFLDAHRGRQDKEGCTPLHWAAIRGNLEACTVLVQAGKKDDLMVTDNTGLTPAQLASDKNHRQVAFFLVGRNITTNEMTNMMRYTYLTSPEGRFRNPYDHGCKKNCSDFLINGYTDDIELLEQTPQSEGINMMPMSIQNGPSGHSHSACSHSKPKTDPVPLGLGLGLGLGIGLGLGQGSRSRAGS